MMDDDGILTTVRRIVGDVLQVPPDAVTAASSRDTLPGWDSIAQVNLVLALEQHFDVQFLPDEMMEMLSVEIVAMLVDEKLAQRRDTRG